MLAFLNLGTQEIILLLIMSIFWIVPLALTIYSIIDLFKRDFMRKSTDRLLIILLITLVPIGGPLIYFFVLRKDYPLKQRAAL